MRGWKNSRGPDRVSVLMKGDKYTAWFLPGLTLIGLTVTFIAGNVSRLFSKQIKIVNSSGKVVSFTLRICDQSDNFSLTPGEEVEHSIPDSCKDDLKFYYDNQSAGQCTYRSDNFTIRIVRFPISETDCE